MKEVFDRTVASKDSKVFHDLNPKAEGHWYYTDVLEHHELKRGENPAYGYNYGHFTIADNLSIPYEQMCQVVDTYDKKSVWYLRDILGKRKQAEGLVYPMFDPALHVVNTTPRPYQEYYVSNDHGTNHPCVFMLFGLYRGVWYLIDEYYHDGEKERRQKTATEYYADLLNFTRGIPVKQVFLDGAPIASAFNVLYRSKGPYPSRIADNSVEQGIQDVATALTTGKLKINDCCRHTIREFGLYRWKENHTKDEPLKTNDDCMDCLRYFVKTHRIVQPRQRQLWDY